ncbi:hypothetical protein Ddye_018294 [Dipteronia dyeriana]|uniref:Reverse transcriptase zinc-binding domain-containing protein n=1 Tax=Dipteronia dyeriana TaxID=168575 RepID=A0AAD9X203_9ROSI|nr:hypothetical protein Ddye_018294 [Dipteronia dyeriana]
MLLALMALWQLQQPFKVKVFCWRVCKDILPVKEVMHNRHFMESNICSLCNSWLAWCCRKCMIFEGGRFKEMDVWCRAVSFLEEF